MKKILFSILIVTLSLMLSARVCSSPQPSSSNVSPSASHVINYHSVNSSNYSYHPSMTSRNYSGGTTISRPYTHVNTGRAYHSSGPIHTMNQRTLQFYRHNPSYIRVRNNYVPYYRHNSFFWYYVILNNRNHRNDTIKARNKNELIYKVNNYR